ncbi:hypothetical protein, partial [Paenibacillus cookii]|uniref:hypothetical protein n=1 Tax=Paenibacillus cookii TaxID=157839 RepID=UPI001BB30C44
EGERLPSFQNRRVIHWVFPCLLQLLPTNPATNWPPLWAFEIQVDLSSIWPIKKAILLTGRL